ncbi:MAG: hypothetical protein B6U85_04755 [Desulfurococcales archaeon ex4484_42]|nr:MAG: hypothetical protein B6U85_04755 [Desulfurococcales archaeon ex4484_42]
MSTRLLTMTIVLAIIITICYMNCPNVNVASSSGVEIDIIAKVYRVIDGDTFDAFPVGRVRLADVNAPERGEPGFWEATEALKQLVLGKQVFLDVDDIYVMDKYNRLVCIVYVRYNSTHLLNVNKWLLDHGYVEIKDYPNEFSPNKWKLYVYYPEKVGKEPTATLLIRETITKTLTITKTYTSPITYTVSMTVTETLIKTVTSYITTTFTKTLTVVKPHTTTKTQVTYGKAGSIIPTWTLILIGFFIVIIIALIATLLRK